MTAADPRDGGSFAAFFADRAPAAVRLATLLVGDPQLAEDVAASAFANVHTRWDRGIRNPPAYLRRAVVNEANSRFRRLGVEREHLQRLRREPAPSTTFDDAVADRDEVLRAVAALPPRQRTVIVLRYYEDLSEAEIAAAMGTSTGTVKSNASRALVRLRELLAADEDACCATAA